MFANEVEGLLPPEHDGEAVECRDRTGRFIGTGIYNSKSQIVWRRLSRDRIALDLAYLRGALQRALARRVRPALSETGPDESPTVRRLVWSESDELPGVVVDQFGDALVVQIQTVAMDKCQGLIGDLLAELLGPAEVILRSDAPIRRLEGPALGNAPPAPAEAQDPRWVRIGGFEYWLDLDGRTEVRISTSTSAPSAGGGALLRLHGAGCSALLQPGPIRTRRAGRRRRGARAGQRRRRSPPPAAMPATTASPREIRGRQRL